MNGNGSETFPAVRFGITDVETLDSITCELIT
jgi:hypothetical protein